MSSGCCPSTTDAAGPSHAAAVAVQSPPLAARQSEVLTRLDTHKYRDIGAALGLTRDGVRYHVKNLFATLRVHDRRDAVRRRARVLGLPPLDD